MNKRLRTALALALTLAAPLTSSAAESVVCTGANPLLKRAYFGDLHVHTLYSVDAYFFNGLNSPREAYRFAKGAPGRLPAGETDPYTAGRDIHLDRPLDFASVTDHSDFLGNWRLLCQVNGLLPIGLNPACNAVGNYVRSNITTIVNGGAPPALYVLTAATAPTPLTALPWQDELKYADEENMPCRFSTFPGFEWTSQFHDQMIHRNTYYGPGTRPGDVPKVAKLLDLTAETSNNLDDDWRLYDWLEQNCDPAKGCKTMTVPHNPNQSGGGMYLPRSPTSGLPPGRGGQPLTLADARLRAKYDRVFEIFQHKGNAECGVGLGIYEDHPDPACGFEMAKNVCRGRADDPADCALYCTGNPATDADFCRLTTAPTYATGVCATMGRNGTSGPDRKCIAPLDMTRNILADGLAIDRVLGINPMRGGVIGSSDTHNGDPGNVSESRFPGHGGVLDAVPRTQLGYWSCDGTNENPADPAKCTNRQFQDRARGFNPGGLAGVWAPENTRAAIWNGLQRGESFATSGPRMRIRTLATWTKPPSNICEQLTLGNNPVDAGAIAGALMGGDLPAPANSGGAPWIVVWAQQDPGGSTPGLPLQRLDIVKGWTATNGEPKVRVFDAVASSSAAATRPGPDCAPVTTGHPERLCTVWRDPQFDRNQNAFWYARAFEVPSCRWSTRMCVDAGIQCDRLQASNGMFPAGSGMEGYEGCCSISGVPGSFHGANAFETVTERAWASPIYYLP